MAGLESTRAAIIPLSTLKRCELLLEREAQRHESRTAHRREFQAEAQRIRDAVNDIRLAIRYGDPS